MGLAIHLLGTPQLLLDGCIQPAMRGQKVWAVRAMLLRSHWPLEEDMANPCLDVALEQAALVGAT